MRKASTLVGLTLFALASTARAQEAAPAASAPAATPPPASEPATAPAPAPADAKPAEVAAAPTAETAEPAPSARKLQLGIAFVPMGVGKRTKALKGVSETNDAEFAYGVGLSADYTIVAGLSIGLAPQIIFNVKGKDSLVRAAKELDVLARVAYTYSIDDTTRVYAEALPGYSLIIIDDRAKGLVVAFGAGFAMDVTRRGFVNVGFGYQMGFQKFEGDDDNTRYVRVVLGGGARF